VGPVTRRQSRTRSKVPSRPADADGPPRVTREDARKSSPRLYERARWLRDHPGYSDDPAAGPAPHPQPCREQGGRFSCPFCTKWRLAVTRGLTVPEFRQRSPAREKLPTRTTMEEK